MSKPFNTVRRFIERHSMLTSATGVLVAVSGGVDSVVLVDMLVRLRTTSRPPTPNPRIHVAHLDHMLRGRESAEDAEFVRGLAERLGLQSSIGSVDIRAVAKARGRGIEEVAREVRYNFLLRAARETGCDRIAVGHTMSDQAETFLMRLVRGAGLRGLAAMRPVSAAQSFSDDSKEKAEGGRQKADDESLSSDFLLLPSVLLIRPLLCIAREEVEAYARERALEFRTDSTNQDLHYTRNRIRNEVVPAVRAVNPRIVESIARAAENIAGDQDVLDHLASSLLDKARLAPDVGRNASEGTVSYSAIELLKQPAALRRRMIIEASRRTRSGVRKSDVNDGEITSAHVAAIEGLLEPRSSGKHVTLPGAVDVWREFDGLAFRSLARAIEEAPYQTAISSARPAAEAGGFSFALRRSQPVGLLKSTIEETQLEAQSTGRDWLNVALDSDALPESLVIRPRLPGERARVVGHRQLIKLKNLMIDHRIPSSRRATWPIVTTPDGCYVWSPGLPPALKFAPHDGTKRIAIVRASSTCFPGIRARGVKMEKTIRIVKSKQEIQDRIRQLAEDIRAAAPAGELTVVGILDDAFVFLADLVRALDVQLNCCFMKVTRHRHGGQSEIMFTSEYDPRGRDILLVGAVAATGVTLDYISEHLRTRGVKSLRTCVLVDKPGERRLEIKPDFVAFETDESFVFGYGLGIQNQYRQLPYLAVMDE